VIRLSGTITYRDGRTQEIEVTQAEYAGFELWALRNGLDPTPDRAPPMTMTRYLGYQAAQRAAHLSPDAWMDWEAWEAGVEDVSLEVPEGMEGAISGATVDPIRAARLVE
jgi:hypothetical protein